MDTNRLYGFAIADIAIGVAAWLLTDNATLGLALIVAGLAVAAFAALRRDGGPPSTSGSPSRDPEVARRREQADEQRRQGATDAETENAEDRPPATGA